MHVIHCILSHDSTINSFSFFSIWTYCINETNSNVHLMLHCSLLLSVFSALLLLLLYVKEVFFRVLFHYCSMLYIIFSQGFMAFWHLNFLISTKTKSKSHKIVINGNSNLIFRFRNVIKWNADKTFINSLVQICWQIDWLRASNKRKKPHTLHIAVNKCVVQKFN